MISDHCRQALIVSLIVSCLYFEMWAADSARITRSFTLKEITFVLPLFLCASPCARSLDLVSNFWPIRREPRGGAKARHSEQLPLSYTRALHRVGHTGFYAHYIVHYSAILLLLFVSTSASVDSPITGQKLNTKPSVAQESFIYYTFTGLLQPLKD